MVKVGTIYGLVNDAGYVEPGTVEDIPMHDVRISLKVTCLGMNSIRRSYHLSWKIIKGEL